MCDNWRLRSGCWRIVCGALCKLVPTANFAQIRLHCSMLTAVFDGGTPHSWGVREGVWARCFSDQRPAKKTAAVYCVVMINGNNGC